MLREGTLVFIYNLRCWRYLFVRVCLYYKKILLSESLLTYDDTPQII